MDQKFAAQYLWGALSGGVLRHEGWKVFAEGMAVSSKVSAIFLISNQEKDLKTRICVHML